MINKHIIIDISYAQNFIQCVCGWEGKAYGNEFARHKKEAPPIIEGLAFESKYEGVFVKRKILEESY